MDEDQDRFESLSDFEDYEIQLDQDSSSQPQTWTGPTGKVIPADVASNGPSKEHIDSITILSDSGDESDSRAQSSRTNEDSNDGVMDSEEERQVRRVSHSIALSVSRSQLSRLFRSHRTPILPGSAY